MLILGHRGTGVTMGNSPAEEISRRRLGQRLPENTLPAFEFALQNGADGIEVDVIKTLDDDLAVCHDEPLNLHVAGADRNSRNLGFIGATSMSSLREFDMGDGYAMPNLREVFDVVARYGAKVFNIEMKGRDCADVLYQQVRSCCAELSFPNDRVLYSSFNHEQLFRIRALDSEAKIGLLFELASVGSAPLYPETFGDEMSVSFSPRYVQSLVGELRPSSLHPCVVDFNDAVRTCAESNAMDIFAWTYREKSPDVDKAVLDFAFKHKDAERINLITDFPIAIKRAILN